MILSGLRIQDKMQQNHATNPLSTTKGAEIQRLIFFLSHFYSHFAAESKKSKTKIHNHSPESVQSLRVRRFRRDKIAGIVEFS